MKIGEVRFLTSVHAIGQLPDPVCPEVAFAGRSNVGKSSLINALTGRRKLVKTSSRPGKTRGMNFFSVDDRLYLVDLPGYGFARVSRREQAGWQTLITRYLRERTSLVLVVVILDLRHPLKTMDRQLIDWLNLEGIAHVPVYTKADKLRRNQQISHASTLDAALGLDPDQRVIFSSVTGQGREKLLDKLALARHSW